MTLSAMVDPNTQDLISKYENAARREEVAQLIRLIAEACSNARSFFHIVARSSSNGPTPSSSEEARELAGNKRFVRLELISRHVDAILNRTHGWESKEIQEHLKDMIARRLASSQISRLQIASAELPVRDKQLDEEIWNLYKKMPEDYETCRKAMASLNKIWDLAKLLTGNKKVVLPYDTPFALAAGESLGLDPGPSWFEEFPYRPDKNYYGNRVVDWSEGTISPFMIRETDLLNKELHFGPISHTRQHFKSLLWVSCMDRNEDTSIKRSCELPKSIDEASDLYGCVFNQNLGLFDKIWNRASWYEHLGSLFPNHYASFDVELILRYS